VFGIQWYAQYDLSDCHIDILKTQGCYRGRYGGGLNNTSPRTLSLVTCAQHTTNPQEPFAVTDDDAFLCVVELKHNISIDSAEAVVNRLGAKILFSGRQELVLVNAVVPSELPEACFLDHYPGIADNILYVPKDSVVPERPLPEDHPILQRVGPGIVAAPNPIITAMLNGMSQDNIMNQIIYLSTDFSGATGATSKITRNSYAIGTQCQSGWKCPRDTITYIRNQIGSMFATYTGPAPIIETQAFRADMCENLIVTIPGVTQPKRYVISGAHLDSRMAVDTRTTAAAPGADDNASGSAVQLDYLRVIAAQNRRFTYSLRIVWFCGEEQGLLGSNALAKLYSTSGVDVIAMFNMDMIGWMYQPPGTPPPPRKMVLTFSVGSTSKELTDQCKAFSQVYLPTLEIGESRGCCSDEQSFHNAGFRAAGIFETPTLNVQYPYYHRETDVYTQVSGSQVYNFGKSFLACIAEHAVPL